MIFSISKGFKTVSNFILNKKMKNDSVLTFLTVDKEKFVFNLT